MSTTVVLDGSEVSRGPARPAHQFQFAALAPAQPPKPIAQPCMPEVLRPPPALAHTFQFFTAPLVTPPPPTVVKPRPLYQDLGVGPPALAHTFQFFASPSANSIGSFPPHGPAGSATFRLDLESGAKLTYSWGTDIFKSYSGREQRCNTTGPRPRQRFEGNAFLLDADTRDLRASLQRAASSGSTFLLALPHEELPLSADTIGNVLHVVTTTLSDWAIVTQRVVIIGTDGSNTYAVIQAVTSNTLTIDVSPGSAAKAGSRIQPLIQVLLEPQQGFARYPGSLDTWSIRAMANAFGWVGQDAMGAGAQIVTYAAGAPIATSSITEDDILIWDRPNQIENTATESMLSLAELVDLGGLPFGIGGAAQPDWARPILYSSTSKVEFQWFKAFVRLCFGRQRAFALSTNRPDLALITAVGSRLKVSNSGDYTSWYASLAHRLLALRKSDGSVQYVGVGSLTDNHDGTLTLALDAVVSGTVTMVSFLEIVRFDNGGSDDFAVTWDGAAFSVNLIARTTEEEIVVPVALPIPPQVLGFPSDSNGVGQDVAPDEYDETFAPTAEIAAPPGPQWRFRYSQSSNDPPPYQTDITTGGVRPYNTPGVQNSGWRQAFAQEAARAGFNCALAELAISGIAAKQCTPAAAFPTSGPNIWSQGPSWSDAAELALGAITRVTVNFIGGNDGFNGTDAGNCQTNLTAIVNGAIAKWGSGIKMIMVRQPDFQSISSAVPFLSTIQTAQDNVAAAFPSNVVQILTADLKGHSDHLHYDGDSAVILGQRIFFAILDALGVARFRPSVSPQIVGWGPQYMGTGAYSPIPPGCGIAGDLEVLICISQMAAGTNNAIGAPTTSGTAWTALTDTSLSASQIVSTFAGSTSRLALFARPVTANRATASTPVTTVPSNSNTINGGRIITIRRAGLTALAVSDVDFIRLAKNDTSGTSLTLPGATAAVSNEGMIAIAGGYRTNATSNPVTMSAAGAISGLVKAFGGNRVVTTDFITNAGWHGALVSGASGGVNVTYALNTIGVGALFGVKP